MFGWPPPDQPPDIYSQFPPLSGTAICWRTVDGHIDAHPPEESVFRNALRAIQCSFAVKLRLPTLRPILIHSPHITSMGIGLSHSIPVIQSTDKLPDANHSLSAVIIRDEEALIVWVRGRVHDLLTQCRVLEHRIQHYGGFCVCQDLTELPADMLPLLPNSASESLDILLEVNWSAVGAAETEPLRQDRGSSSNSPTSSLPSLSELPSLYGITSGESVFQLSVFESSWYSNSCGPGSLWDDEVVYRSGARADSSQKELMGPPRSPPPSRVLTGQSLSPILSESPSSSSSNSPPPTSSCSSSTLTTPQTISLSDISPPPLPAPLLVDTDCEMSAAEDSSDDEDSPLALTYGEPSSKLHRPTPVVLRPEPSFQHPKGLRPNIHPPVPSLPRTRGRRAANPTPTASASASTNASSSRKRKAPAPSSSSSPRRPPLRPSTSSLKPRTTTRSASSALAATHLETSPLTSISELSDADGDYEEPSGAQDDSDDEYVEARRPVKRQKLASGGGKTPSRAPRRQPSPRAPIPTPSVKEEDEEEGDKAEAGIWKGPVPRPVRKGRGMKWSCTMCNEVSFSRIADTERHMKSACKKLKDDQRDKFPCQGQGCESVFNRVDARKRHMKTCTLVPRHVRDELNGASKKNSLFY